MAKDTDKTQSELLAELTRLRAQVAELQAQGPGRNVTERERSEERFRITAEVTTDLIYQWNVVDDTMEWFGDIDGMVGYAPGEVPRTIEGWVDLIHPEDRARLADSVERHRRGTEPIFEEYRVQRKDGTWRYWVDRGAPVLDDAGAPCRWIGGCQDVTERRRAEEALRASEQKHRLLLKHLPQRVFFKDRELVFVSCNDNFARDLGITPDEIAGKTDYDFYPEELAEKYCADDRRIMASGHLEDMEETHVQDGEELIVQVVKTPVADESGTVTGILGVFWDITERKRAEEALRESEERFRKVYETAPLGFVLWDRECRVTGWNRRAEELFGWTREEALGRSFFDFIIPEGARPRVAAVVEALLRGEIEPRVINENQTKSGETILCEWSNSVLYDREGRVTGAMSLALDITERKRAEEERLNLERQVQHAQKLESLGVLAGGIAHDFNNLLVSILGNADLALEEMSPHAPARENVKAIEEGAIRAADLAKQMLAYSGKGKFATEAIDLSEFVEEMAHLLRVVVSKKAVLKFNFADHLPAIEADATQVRQVIMNLITNASEAVDERSGVVAVSTGVMDCDSDYLAGSDLATRAGLAAPLPEGPYVYLEVTDTGCGMDAATQGKLFDPFFTTKFTGRGLGMAAVLGIVRGHKGVIKVYSEVGRGTTIKVLFPASHKRPRAAAADEARQQAQAARFSGTILLVDDEKIVRKLTQRMLERLGFAVLSAADGREAVDVFRAHAADVACVILDLTMPGMDGEAAFRELRRIRSDVRVIMSSGYNEQEVAERFVGKGMAGFLQKPYQLGTLSERLRAALDQ